VIGSRLELAQPFLILIPEGAPLLSHLLRHGGDFDLRELRMPSQVPRPVPAKNAGARMGQPLDLRFYSERMGQPPAGVSERSHAVGAESHPSKNVGWDTRRFGADTVI
jgi:hypothetical protein